MHHLVCFQAAARLVQLSLFGIVGLSLFSVSALGEEGLTLMPLPKSVELSSGALPLAGPLAVSWAGCESPQLSQALERLRSDFTRRTGLMFTAGGPVPLAIVCKNKASLIEAIRDEGYRLVVNEDGIHLKADGPAGVLRAFATLRQLVNVKGGKAEIPQLRIEDVPRFAWRGVMLDPARHFIEVDTLKRQLNAMEQLKLNVLHLHLSDDQGFRVESQRFPKLNSTSFTGSSSPGRFYTQNQIRELVTYAADRGILIVPEFDMPGHSRAMVEAYPDIGLRKPSALIPGLDDVALNPASPQTYRFLEELLTEMADLFPGSYFHIGGDEVSQGVWEGKREVQALMSRENLSTKTDVEGYFASRVIELVRRLGKAVIGWDELVEAGVDQGVTIQAWQTSNDIHEAVSRGHQTIVSAGYYLDLLMPAEFHYVIDPLDPSAAGFTPQQAAQLRAAYPPLAAFLTDELVAKPLPALESTEQDLVLGAEVALWGELVSDEMVDARLWPRAAALAERFWSAAEVRDVADMYRRLSIIDDQLAINGLGGSTNRSRMMLRLSPGQVDPLATLLNLVSPVRNMAHDHRIPAMLRGKLIQQPLNSLADAAPSESLLARQFEAEVRRFLEDDKALAPSLRAQLLEWEHNHLRLLRLAHDNEGLQPALPSSAFVADLARVGQRALEAVIDNRSLSAETAEKAEALLAKAEREEMASRLPLVSLIRDQPPADLIVAIAPGIELLVSAAMSGGAENKKP